MDWHPLMIRLGKSVQELANETIEEIMGYQGKGGHKPARPDIQKMKDVSDLYHRSRSTPDAVDPDSYDAASVDGAKKDWGERYGLSNLEQMVVGMYKNIMTRGDMRGDPQKAFEFVVHTLQTSDKGFVGHEADARRFVGNALKKYEQQNWPMLYRVIDNALADAYRRGPLESYKLWPRMVQWIKDDYQDWLLRREDHGAIPTEEPRAMAGQVNHIVDIVTEGGALLDRLRRENRLPQGFDVNRISFQDFEDWLMQWKRDNREAEAQGEVVYKYDDGWTMQKLTTPEQLQFEGDEMGHCVGGYCHIVGSGEDIIYSLRDPKGMPHVTIEVMALEGPPHNGYDWDDNPPEDASYNHEYIHPDRHEPGQHMEEIGGDYIPSGENAFEVVQVQGNSNHRPKPEYQRKVKDFLDYLRSKGWKFERSDNWYPNEEDRYEGGEYGNEVKDARSLDEWYDNSYKSQHELYRGVNSEDAYGLPSERKTIGIDDWDELFKDSFRSLLDDYDPGRWRGNWRDLAQAVYHAWMIDIYKDHLDPEALEQHRKNLVNEIQDAEQTLHEWSDENWYHAEQHMGDEIAEEVKEEAERRGELQKIETALNEEYGEDMWDDSQLLDWVRDNDDDLYYHATDKARDEATDYYAGDAYKFVNYLIHLAEKHGGLNPQDLPNPNDRHGGLPSYEELQEMPWLPDQKQETPVEEGLPGALSKTAAAMMYHVAPVELRDTIGREGLRAQAVSDRWGPAVRNQPDGLYVFANPVEARRFRDVYGGDIWATSGEGAQPDPGGNFIGSYFLPTDRSASLFQRHEELDGKCWQCGVNEKGMNGAGQPMSICNNCLGWHPEKNANADYYQIYPIDQEHNVWFDEDGNQRERYRPGWAKDPATGKMRQTGELEDTFLDKQGRQGQGWVAYHGDKPIGSLTYVADPAGWNMLGTTYVHPDYREQGLFNRMVAPLREEGKPIDAYVWNNPWLKNKVRGWQTKTAMGMRGDLPTLSFEYKAPGSTDLSLPEIPSVEATVDGRVIGYLAWSEDTIHDVWVSENYRRMGVATAMKREAERIAGHPIQHSDDRTPDADGWASASSRRTASIPDDQRVYIAEGALARGGLAGPVVSTQKGHPNHPSPEGVAESQRVSELASQIIGRPIIVNITDWIDGSDGAHGEYDRMFNRIAIKPGEPLLTLLHECAHALSPIEGHGPEFIDVAARLYTQYLGEEAGRSFRELATPPVPTE